MVDLILLIRSVSDIAMFTLIWLVQLVIYPAFHVVERDIFVQWHARYTRNISLFVMPLMMAQGTTTVLLLARNPGTVALLELACLLAAWGVTFSLSVPCHKKLHETGRDEAVIARLIRTNWFRTAAWTAVMLLGWWPD